MRFSGSKQNAWRKFRASWRDTTVLLRQFWIPLASFALVVIGGGFLYWQLAAFTSERINSPVRAMYLILTLSFLQPTEPFPSSPSLQLFYFLVPFLGLGILATGLTDFGIMLFNRRMRRKEWEMAVASTYNKHIIVIGIGHLGFRVLKYLHQLNEDIVAIELDPDSELIANAQKMNIPVIAGDAAKESILEAAGIGKARTLVLCTQNDALNLQIAVKARSLNPAIHVVIRIFDEDFADALHSQFGFSALSGTSMAAPAFAAAASGSDMTRPITIEDQLFSVATLVVRETSLFKHFNVEKIEQKYDLSIILLTHHERSETHPSGNTLIEAGDRITIFGHPERLSALIQDNK